MLLEVLTQTLTDAAVYNATTSASNQPTTSQFQWNGRTIGLAVGTGVLVITCVALGVLVNPAFFGAIPVILGGAWALMGSPTINDLIGNSTPATAEEKQSVLQSLDATQHSITKIQSSSTHTNGSPFTAGVGATSPNPSDINSTTVPSASALSNPAQKAYVRTISSPEPTLTGQSNSPSRPFESQKAAQKASDEFLKAMSPNRGLSAISNLVFGADKKIDLNKLHDLVFAKTFLENKLKNHSEFALEFLSCAEYLYEFQANAISSDSKLTNLQKIDAQIALCDEIISMIPNTNSGSELIGHFNLKKTGLVKNKQSLIQQLEHSFTQSAQHLGQNLFPGQQGTTQNYTLSGEVQALIADRDPRNELQPIDELISTISVQITQIDREISSEESKIKALESQSAKIIESAKLTQEEWSDGISPEQDLGRDIRESYKDEIRTTLTKLKEINSKINSVKTRTELIELIKKRYDCYANLLQLQYHYEILNLHLHVEAGYEYIDNKKIEPIIENISRIKNELNLLSQNANLFKEQINKFKEANAKTDNPDTKLREKALREKEIARKNIARLLADPLCVQTTHVEMPRFASPVAQHFYEILNRGGGTSLQKYLDEINYLDELIKDYSEKVNKMDNKLGILKKISNIPSTREKLDEIRSSIISKNSSKEEMNHRLEKNKTEKAEIERKISTLNQNIKKLSEHLDRVCNQEDFQLFVTTYRDFARATNVPENQWASNILDLLTKNFPLLNKLSELQKPILDALKANGIDTTQIQSKPLNPHPVPASSSNQTTTPLALMMGAGPQKPNFDDEIDFITREVNRMRPTSASSNASPYAQYNQNKLKDI